MVPPAVGGFHRPNNISNPFNQFPPQQQHYQHQNANFHPGLNHPGFQTTQQASHVNLFQGPGLSNGVLAAGFGGAAFGGAAASGLASREAQIGFRHGAAIEQQQAQDAASGMGRTTGMATRIREVWKNNLQQEMDIIRNLVDKYPFVSMDTEFPGVVARPMGNFPSKADYHYQCLRCNVDLLKLIQLGITLFSADGDVPPAHADTLPSSRAAYPNNLIQCPTTWTFNFDFSLEEDMYSEDSIAMLKKAGVDFEKTAAMGINPREFGSLLTTSGLVTAKNVCWLSFHSGYDFGYLYKIMQTRALPDDEEEYLRAIKLWFPRIFDVKYLFRHAQRQAQRQLLAPHATNIINELGQKSGLQDLADALGCQREGRPHTAGSDAWLTGLVFWQMRQKVFEGEIPEELIGMIWGLSGVGPPASAATQAAAMQTPHTNGATLYHTGMTPTTYKNDVPTTPQTSHSGLDTTPGHQSSHGFAGGNVTGAFSNFQQYGAR